MITVSFSCVAVVVCMDWTGSRFGDNGLVSFLSRFGEVGWSTIGCTVLDFSARAILGEVGTIGVAVGTEEINNNG